MAADNQFRLETNGHCILCLKLVGLGSCDIENQSVSENVNIQSFVKNFNIRLNQLKGLSEELELTSVLCRECGAMTRRFSELAMELKRIQDELESCTKSIKEKVRIGEGSEAGMAFQKALMSTDDFNYDVVNSFRNEIMSHCSTQVMKSEQKAPVIGFMPPPLNCLNSTHGTIKKDKKNVIGIGDQLPVPKWREKIISRVTKRLQNRKDRLKGSKPQLESTSARAPLGMFEDPKIRFPLEYSQARKCLTVANKPEILFDDTTESLSCRICGWSKSTKKGKDAEEVLYFHVLGKHFHLFDCPKPGCGKKYADISQYRIHLDTHRNDDLITPVDLQKSHKCNRCELSFTSMKKLSAHRRHHHPAANPPQKAPLVTPKETEKDDRTCELCYVAFTRYYPIDRTLTKGKLTCEMCYLSFPTRAALRLHRQRGCWPPYTVSYEVKEFSCKVCRKTFKTPLSLQQHQQNQHPDQGKCDNCLEKMNVQRAIKLEAQESMPVPIEDEESMESVDMELESNYEHSEHSVVKAELFYDEGESDNDQFILPDES